VLGRFPFRANRGTELQVRNFFRFEDLIFLETGSIPAALTISR
jgi:hypothetical protein